MARISTDDGFGRDPRLDRLAELCGWTRRETAGCLQLDIWPICYDRVTPNIPARDLDIAAARGAVTPVAHARGFSGALVESGFARPSTRKDTTFEWVRKDKAAVSLSWKDPEWRDRIYVRGAAERIAYLIKSEESGRIGGQNSGTSRGNSSKGPLRHPSRDPQGSGNPTPTATDTASASAVATDQSKNSARPSVGGDRDLFGELEAKCDAYSGDVGKARANKARKAKKPFDHTEAEAASVRLLLDKLGQHTGTQYSGADEHVRLIVGRLRDGVTEWDLRCVIGYCAHPTGLGWTDKPDLSKYLRPETLFGPRTISKYLDAARSWATKHIAQPEQQEMTT